MNSVALIIPYFGQFPVWADLYFETLIRNSTIDFHFFTNVESQIDLPANIHFHLTNFEEYIQKANQFIDFDFNPPNAYKICDLRPLFGLIHQDVLKEYDFYG